MHPTEILRCALALLAGGLIGSMFGAIQDIAFRRNAKKQQSGQFNNAWLAMPGSMRRVAYLLIALVLVQILCPLLFAESSQWYVSAGVVFGYGWFLYRRLARQRASNL
jgi:hypothetical protein